MMSIILWVSLGGFLALGLPIAFSILGISISMLIIEGSVSTLAIAQKMINSVDSFPLMAIPFFIFAGDIMNKSGVTDKIFDFAKSLVGHLPGGLGQVNVLSSVLFAGMSGSLVADIVGLGKIEMKAMNDAGYDKPFSAAITAASAVIGPIIPPSIPLVLYGSIANISVMKLLAGGLVPGFILAFSLMIVVGIIAKKRNYPKGDWPRVCIVWAQFKIGFAALMMPIILMGGILGGVMTPTEAACFACFYAVFIGKFVYKSITWKDIWSTLKKSSAFLGSTLLIVAAAGLMGQVLTQQNIPQRMLMFLSALTQNKYVILILINFLLIVLGCLMESAAIIVVLTPLLAQVAISYGIDPIHFGVLVVLNLMISNLTPPVGMGLFMAAKVGNVKFNDLLREVTPFLIVEFVVLIIITFIPFFVTFLPNLIS